MHVKTYVLPAYVSKVKDFKVQLDFNIVSNASPKNRFKDI